MNRLEVIRTIGVAVIAVIVAVIITVVLGGRISRGFGGDNMLHTRIRHLRNHLGSSVAFSDGFSSVLSDTCSVHFPMVLSIGLSLFQWICLDLFNGFPMALSSGISLL